MGVANVHRQLRKSANGRLKVNPAAAGRIKTGEDRPRKRDTQRTELASAKRILAPEERLPRWGATHVRPTARSAIFLPPFARKTLLILDSGKRKEIL